METLNLMWLSAGTILGFVCGLILAGMVRQMQGKDFVTWAEHNLDSETRWQVLSQLRKHLGVR